MAWRAVLEAAEAEHDLRVDSYRAYKEGWHDQADVDRRFAESKESLRQAWLTLAAAAERPWQTVACLLALERMGRQVHQASSRLLPPAT